MKTFVVETPDGRHVRHQHESLEIAKTKVIAGYKLIGEVKGAFPDGTGGYMDPIEGPSLFATLLAEHAEELKAWLRANLPTLDVKKRA